MVSDVEDAVARKIVNEVMRSDYEVMVLKVMAEGSDNPTQSLFYAGALAASRQAVESLNSELRKAETAIAAMLAKLEPALESALNECPDGDAAFQILEVRNVASRFCSEAWADFWQAHAQHFAGFLGLKAELLNKDEKPDYGQAADAIIALGEDNELHPFYLWYSNTTPTLPDLTARLARDEPLSADELDECVRNFKAEPSRSRVMAEFVAWARDQWSGVIDNIKAEAVGEPLPTFDFRYKVGRMLAAKYPLE